MAKTYQTAIDEARTIAQDTDADGYRHANLVYIDKLNRALQELARLRPDAFWSTFVTDDVVVPEVTPSNLADAFPTPLQFYHPVIYFMVGSIEMIDDEFATDGRAMMLLSAFKTSVVSL